MTKKYHNSLNLANSRLGARVVYVTDEFFAPCERMLQPTEAVFIEGKYDDHGKWMDGWESRRKRVEGYDYCVVKLAQSGVLEGVDIDTRHFKGNHPPQASIDACFSINAKPDSTTEWVRILDTVDLKQDSAHLFDIQNDQVFSHVRLNIYPDGGVARFRVYGEPYYDWSKQNPTHIIDLFSFQYGGRAIACSNEGFGSSMHRLNYPGRGFNMGDGWETARRRGPGHDWVILALGHPASLKEIQIDTAHYKGNYPDRISAQAANLNGVKLETIEAESDAWAVLLPEQKLKADSIHSYQSELIALGVVTHVRVNMIPDGGLSRVRLLGRPEL